MSRCTSGIVIMSVVGALVGCEDGTGNLDGGRSDVGVGVDAGPSELTFCESYTHEQDEQGELEFVPNRCGLGAVCGTGVSYVLCIDDQSRVVSGWSGQIEAFSVEIAKQINSMHPYCRSSADCGIDAICLFQAGCAAPEALCCGSATCGAGGVRPIEHCEETSGCQLEYCGCDGETFEGLPDRPYAYPGPCR